MREALRSVPVGAGLLALLAGWAFLSSPSAPGASRCAAAILLLATAVVAGSVAATWWDPAAPGGLVLAGVLAVMAASYPASFSGAPLAPPLHYANADGLLLVCAAAGAVVGVRDRGLALRAASAALAGLLALACATIGAQASALAAGLLAVWALARPLGRAVVWTVVGGLVLLVPDLATFGWASGLLGRPEALVQELTPERFALWSEAWDILTAHPLRGAGPGRFADLAPTAADPDLAWAHSYSLGVAADLGAVGLTLLALVLLWSVVAAGRDAVVVALLLLPASIDHLLEQGWLLVAVGLVSGACFVSTRHAGTRPDLR